MRPKREELIPFMDKRALAARQFAVSERTITRWLRHYDLFTPRYNFGPNKLNIGLARQIRKLHRDGRSMKELAQQHHVTFATISRIIHNICYRQVKPAAKVAVIYNLKAVVHGVVLPYSVLADKVPEHKR